MDRKSVREEAERRVTELYGPWDAPGFEACVAGEMAAILSRQKQRRVIKPITKR